MQFASRGLPDFFDGGSFHGVHLQHVLQKAYDGGVEILRREKDPVADLLEERWHVVVVEGERPAQQGIEDDAAAPDVHLRPGVQPARQEGTTRRRVYSAPSWNNGACGKR